MEKGKTIGELKVGQRAEFTKIITEEDVQLFAKATGDSQPVHLDEAYAKTTRFGQRIAHGLLTAGLISAVLGTKLPGPGTIYNWQEMKFLKPVYIGDEITAVVIVSNIDTEKNRVMLKTECFNQKKALVLSGYAVVIPPAIK
ncbi:MAG: MaoC family dehydratase [Parcubacteria group bacterium]|nr:MaoC family dehydratase [Parcubacteria group bacterium]